MSLWTDFNDAPDAQAFEAIPPGTAVKVRLSIRPGGYNDPSQGLTNGIATRSKHSDAIYLDGEFVVLDGPYAKRKIWTMIGIYSSKGPEWTNMGRQLIKGILNSAHGLRADDNSPGAQQKRCINDLSALQGMVFVAKVGLESDNRDGSLKNTIKSAISAEHPAYAQVMGSVTSQNAPTAHHAPIAQDTPRPNPPSTRPAWAQ